MTNFVLTHPSFENVKQSAQHIVNKLDEDGFRPDRIVALARGGAILGVVLSHKLNVPVTIVAYSSKKGKGDDRNHDNQLPLDINAEKILIVDDLTDSGHSMLEVVTAYSQKFEVKSATMYAKEGAVHQSDYFWHWLPKNSPFIHFPWEV